MKGNETRLVEFMDGSKKRFVIPVYQRNYDWKQENCKQLFDDLVKVEKGGRRTHFFGSVDCKGKWAGATDDRQTSIVSGVSLHELSLNSLSSACV